MRRGGSFNPRVYRMTHVGEQKMKKTAVGTGFTEAPLFLEHITPATYAIFQTGGKQYFAVEGKTIEIETIDGEIGSHVEFGDVLFKKDSAGAYHIGQPFLSTPVKAEIIKNIRGPKLIVFKFKRRKKSRVKQGHRQNHTIIRVLSF